MGKHLDVRLTAFAVGSALLALFVEAFTRASPISGTPYIRCPLYWSPLYWEPLIYTGYFHIGGSSIGDALYRGPPVGDSYSCVASSCAL